MSLKKDSYKEIIIDSIICGISAFIMLILVVFRLFAPIDNMVYDTFLEFRAGGHVAADNTGIVIVAIDEGSLTEMNQRWPWERSLYAKAIDFLSKAEAKAIALDLLFIEPSKDISQDHTLAESMRKATNVVIASKLERLNKNFSGDEISFSGQRLVLPLEMFRRYAASGIVNLELSSGSVVRKLRPYYMHNEEKIPNFAMQIYSTAFNKKPNLPAGESLFIDFLGGPQTFPTIPIYQIIKGEVKPELFKDKIVMIGASFSDAHDFFATPLAIADKPSTGVEVQANILASMINEQYVTMMSLWPQITIILTLAALGGYLAMFRSAYYFWAAFITVTTLVICFSIWMVNTQNLFFDISYPLLALPMSFFMVMMHMRKPMVLETKVGPYVLHEELGRGGMAVVYRATHPKTKETVALKQMLAQYTSDKDSIGRFLRETEILKQLDHPNIIKIIDAGEVNGCPYYAMELITGTALDRELKDNYRFDLPEVRKICGAIARALALAHQLGIIHRDIKPSNIMVTNMGVPKLTDFGIAKSSTSLDITLNGVIVGTPGFLAPELCKGEQPTALSDIYSFGATLYRLISGRLPFAGRDFKTTISMVLTTNAKDIRSIRGDIDDDMAHLIMSCLEKDPAKRPQNMMEVAKTLDPFYTDIALKSTIQTQLKTQIEQATPEGKTTLINPEEVDKTTVINTNGINSEEVDKTTVIDTNENKR
jgi:serine/threonine protein kinase/CHASE2 domain-containing sensor protein